MLIFCRTLNTRRQFSASRPYIDRHDDIMPLSDQRGKTCLNPTRRGEYHMKKYRAEKVAHLNPKSSDEPKKKAYKKRAYEKISSKISTEEKRREMEQLVIALSLE